MSRYPSMDEYNGAVQHPKTAFFDPVLKTAKIATNGMGLPIALGGGFALTYRASTGAKKFAVRCFHKEARDLEARYAHIDKGLRGAGGNYFVGFEFQPGGVLINGKRFPIVKMEWVDGDTLGSFLEDNYGDRSAIELLSRQFINLERFLRQQRVAHGDLQNGNVVVGSSLKLIDYDGMYVPSLPTGKGAELGQKHFQHPKRTADDFGPDMDRFSFIVIDLSLRALAENPGLFSTHSNGENIIFAAGDFLDPGRSPVFRALKSSPRLARDAANFAAICFAGTKGIPALSDFLAGQNIPSSPIVVPPSKQQTSTASRPAYVGAYDVLNAASYSAVAKQVGNKVELVGIVTRVHLGWTRQRRPYCFIFFDNSRQCVKLNIWSNGLGKLTGKPTEAWVGKWLSVQGLVDPAFSNKNGTSLSITVDAGNQIRQITQAEAQRRLRKPGTASAGASSRNQTVLAQLNLPPPAATTPAPVRKQRKATRKAASAPPAASTVQFKNQAILTALQQGQPSRPAVKPTRSPPPTSVRPSTAPVADVPWGWIVFGVIALLFFLGSLR